MYTEDMTTYLILRSNKHLSSFVAAFMFRTDAEAYLASDSVVVDSATYIIAETNEKILP